MSGLYDNYWLSSKPTHQVRGIGEKLPAPNLNSSQSFSDRLRLNYKKEMLLTAVSRM